MGCGVAVMMTRHARCLESCTPVSDYITTARFYSKYIKTPIVQVYALANDEEDEEKKTFLQSTAEGIRCVPQTQHALGNGGLEYQGWREVVG